MRRRLIRLGVAALLAATVSASPGQVPPTGRPLLDEARQVARWLRAVAVKTPEGVAWAGTPAAGQTPGFWNNLGQCCGSAGVGDFFLSYYEVTREADALAFARRMTDQILARATRDASGTRWVHADDRTRPENLAAQTGWMQGAAGIGAWLLRLDGFDRGRAARIVLPDSPFGR